jgi:hypothetical protein
MPRVSCEVAAFPSSHNRGIRDPVRRLFSFPVFVGAMVGLAAALVTTLWEPGPVIAGRVVVEGDTWYLCGGNRSRERRLRRTGLETIGNNVSRKTQ